MYMNLPLLHTVGCYTIPCHFGVIALCTHYTYIHVCTSVYIPQPPKTPDTGSWLEKKK